MTKGIDRPCEQLQHELDDGNLEERRKIFWSGAAINIAMGAVGALPTA